MNYLLSEKTKNRLDEVIAGQSINLVGQGRGRRSASPGVPGSSPYTLFEVVQTDDTSIVINGYSSPDRLSHNLITHGLTTIELADAVSVTGITASGVIYLSIIWTGSTYTATPLWAASMPAQDTTHIYWYLADVICASSKITAINQPPISQINIPARAG